MSHSVNTTKCPDGTFYGAVSNDSGIVVAMSPPLDTRAKARGWAEREARRLDTDPTPPAPVASDPVTAECAAETVLGVFRVAEYASAAEAEREAQSVVPLGGRYVPLGDGGVEWVPDAPAMVPQPAQQQQGRDTRRGMARCDEPGEWQIGIWCVTRQPGGTWEARATGPGTIGDGSPHSYPTLAAAYLGLTGEPMPGASRD